MTADDIVKLLDQLAGKLSDPAQHVFDIAVRQMVIEGIFQGILVVVLVVFLPLITLRVARRFNVYLEENRKESAAEDRWLKNPEDYPFAETVASWIARMVSFGFFVAGLACLREALNYLANPEWQVIMKLAQLIPGASK